MKGVIKMSIGELIEQLVSYYGIEDKEIVRKILEGSRLIISNNQMELVKDPGIKDEQSLDKATTEVEVNKNYIVFYLTSLEDSRETDWGLKTFKKLKGAEEEIKEIYYDKSTYSLLLKGLNYIEYRLVTKTEEGKSKLIKEGNKVSRGEKLYIQYYDGDD